MNKPTDFNDLHRLAGLDAVLSQVEAADNNSVKLWPEAVNLRELAKKEPTAPRFIMPGWLPCGYATMFSGHGGAGKSSISLVLIVCIALGRSFHGNPVEQRKVLFLSCEDRIQVLHWRLSHICRFFGVSIDILSENLSILDLVGHDNIIYQPSRKGPTLTPIYHELSGRMKEYGAQVLVVDGISDTYDGNENSRAEPKAFVNALLALVPAEEGAVLLLGHVAKSSANNAQTNEGYSGSTAWHNAVRARWYLYPETKSGYDKRQDPTGKLILELQKSNLGKADKSMCFEWDDAAHMFAHVQIEEESHFDKNYRETKERNEILSTIVNCTVDIPAASSGQRTAFHVLVAQPKFPFTATAGNAERKCFWRHIETLRAMGMVTDGFITREDRHKVRLLVATDKAKSVCGHAGYAAGGVYRGGLSRTF
ncbi:MAG: AAA family ATPase [Verrucomicrobia bacterium]|nr:AAA family ATPase [Deltaproteobacteria bacterium]